MMHNWQEHNWGGGHWIVAIVLMGLFWAGVAAIVIALIRTRGRSLPGRPGGLDVSRAEPATTDAERILHDRFARGEIDDEEYIRRHDLLKQRSR